jgi:hypothetical protein
MIICRFEPHVADRDDIKKPHTDGVVAIAANDTYMVTGGKDGIALLWNRTNYEVVAKVQFPHNDHSSDQVKGCFIMEMPKKPILHLVGVSFKEKIYISEFSDKKTKGMFEDSEDPWFVVVNPEVKGPHVDYAGSVAYEKTVTDIKYNSKFAIIKTGDDDL